MSSLHRLTNISLTRPLPSSIPKPSIHTCKFGKCSIQSTSTAEIAYHEAEEHCRKRFFCPVCRQDLSSFEALRTHTNSQHTRTREFECDVCHTPYLDPARRAKCRKRHQGQFRCPMGGCRYHNCRPNSVVKHAKSQHDVDLDGSNLEFDCKLGTKDPPKTRRPPAVRGVGQVPLILNRELSDTMLFKQSELVRRKKMADLRNDHVQWIGGEDALRKSIPNYPVWQPRDHAYGRIASPVALAPDVGSSCGTSAPVTSSPTESLWDVDSYSPLVLTTPIQQLGGSSIEGDFDFDSFMFGGSSGTAIEPSNGDDAPQVEAWPSLFPPMPHFTIAAAAAHQPIAMPRTTFDQHVYTSPEFDPTGLIPASSASPLSSPFESAGLDMYNPSWENKSSVLSSINTYGNGSGSFGSDWMHYSSGP